MALPTVPNIPNPTLIIDLSQFQVNADLVAAKAAGVAAVILKATEGATFQDPGSSPCTTRPSRPASRSAPIISAPLVRLPSRSKISSRR
jgi:hypothetical protein